MPSYRDLVGDEDKMLKKLDDAIEGVKKGSFSTEKNPFGHHKYCRCVWCSRWEKFLSFANTGHPDDPVVRHCLDCGHLEDEDAEFCSSCGRPMRRTCPKCGRAPKPGERHCPRDGTKLN